MRRTIRFKFLSGFFIIFFVSIVLLTLAVNNALEGNNQEIITREMKAVKENSNVIVRQSFMINHFNNDEVYFKQIARNIAEELRIVTESDISVYSIKGKMLYNTGKAKLPEYEDVSNAVKGKMCYVIRTDNNKVMVYFSYPVVIADNQVGILRIVKDYSDLYTQSRHISRVIFIATLAVFFIAFIFSYLLSRDISNPLLRLNHAANKVAGGVLEVSLESTREDEIGELTRNFSKMVEKISNQIITIQKDRDNLAEINNYKKRFFDNVTHELKTPLTTIMGYAQTIYENDFTDKEFFESGMNHIINESKRLHEMVLRLLELSKDSCVVEEEFKVTDISKLLRNTINGMQLKAQRYGNVIECDINEDICICGDSDRLKQVFINIIDNAIKYGYPDSAIKVVTAVINGFVEIYVINNGEGIKEEHMSEIFTPFYRVDKSKSREMGSCGLGMPISKTIVENHKGQIEIASEPYKQTIVTIRLPLYNVLMHENKQEALYGEI